MAIALRDRVRCTTNTVGQGTYTINAAVDGSHRNFSMVGSGVQVSYCCTDGVRMELAYGTVTVDSTVTLTRDSVVASTNSNAAVDWPDTAAKDIFLVALAQDVVITKRTQTFTEPQNMNGQELRLSPDNAVKMVATNGEAKLAAGANAELTLSTVARGRLMYNAAGSGAGPTLELMRDGSRSANDPIGRIDFLADDSAGNETIYAAIRAVVDDTTNGSEDGTVKIGTMLAGTLTDFLTLTANNMILRASTHLLLGGKTSIDTDSAGIELRSTGLIAARAASSTVAVFGRDDDGTIVSLRTGGTQQGAISASGATVTYSAFSGSHWAWWGKGCAPEGWPDREPPVGSVLCAVDEDYRAIDGVQERMCMVRLSARRGDPAVYGLYGGTMKEKVWMAPGQLDAILRDRPWLGEAVLSRQTVEVETAERQKVRREIDTGKRMRVEVEEDTGRKDPFGRAIVRRMERSVPIVAEAEVEEPVTRPAELVTFRRILVSGLGMAPAGVLVAGPCGMGDLLWASDLPGVAEIAPVGAGLGQILGKAYGIKRTAAPDLVRAALWAS